MLDGIWMFPALLLVVFTIDIDTHGKAHRQAVARHTGLQGELLPGLLQELGKVFRNTSVKRKEFGITPVVLCKLQPPSAAQLM